MNKLARILKEELIGRKVKVIMSKNKSNIGIEGNISDETKHILTISTPRGMKKIHKSGSTFQFDAYGKKLNVEGTALLAAPEERIKMKVK